MGKSPQTKKDVISSTEINKYIPSWFFIHF